MESEDGLKGQTPSPSLPKQQFRPIDGKTSLMVHSCAP
eukprot:CCRYP_015219-RI/>CCRYP_015219-RI protein AED:0.49 eAED:0.49 QI:0/-1/0/1/-1/0/1/0/37